MIKKIRVFIMLLFVMPALHVPGQTTGSDAESFSRLRAVIENYREDYGILNRYYSASSNCTVIIWLSWQNSILTS
jgi:hypothetical protein